MADEERELRKELNRGLLTRREVVIRASGAVGGLGLASLLAACGGKGGGNGGGKEIATMTWAINGEAVAMDYALAYDFNTNVAVANITEPLLRFDPHGKLQPNLATAWDQVDPLTLKVTLRSGVKFHDGTAMTADDVAYSLNRHRDPKVGSYLATFHERVSGVRASGPNEVTVKFSKPDAIFPYALATMAGAVASKAFIEANGKKVGTPGVGIVGTGPYKYGLWTKGQEIVLNRFDGYWNKSRPLNVKKFVVKIILDEATIVQALGTGEVDGVFGTALSGKSVKATEKFDTLKVYRAPSYQVHYLIVNTQMPPFDDQRVRQALSYAIDKTGILQSTWGGIGTAPIKSPATPAMWTFEQKTFKQAYDALPSFDLNIEKAKALVQQAGATGAKAEMLVALPFDQEQALAIQDAGKKIGLNLSPKKIEITDKIAQEFSGKDTRSYHLSVSQWGADIPDPAGNLLVPFYSKNVVTNNSAYHNPKVDKLLEQQRETTDPAKRAKILIEAQAIIVPDQPWIVFYSPDSVMVLNNRLSGYQIRPLTYWDPFVADFSGTA